MTFNIHNISAQQDVHIEYYDNGKPKEIGFKTSKGNVYGEWVYYRNDGSINIELAFNKQSKPEGPFKMYFNNGQLQTKGNYSGEGFYEMEGNYEDYHKNGQLHSIGVYKKNEPTGKWINYFDNGQVESLVEYSYKGVIQKNTVYFKNGQLRLDAQYNQIGDIVGELIIYYTNGQIRIKQVFDDLGNRTGKYISYYPNGKLMETGDYAGIDYFQKKGVWKTYHKNGQLETKITYDNKGERIGDIIQYDEK